MAQRQFLPIGIQTFEKLRRGNYRYIDKTEYVYKLTHSDFNYAFLSRPRRFGKSLLVSTLHSYFDGRRDLFEGLAMEGLEKEWAKYPVLHFDMSLGKHMDREGLERYLHSQLDYQSKAVGVEAAGQDTNVRMTNLIKAAYEHTGRQVVVLIDEYDAPLLDVVHEDRDLPVLRNVMRNFYSPLKACDPYLRFVFLTGITKFSQLSIFSELNNIKNISMMPEYSALCGITEEEMCAQLKEHFVALAEAMKVTPEEALKKLKMMYDGYHFTWPSSDIYNPYSLLNALSDRKLGSFWFGSGTPTYLIEMLKKHGVVPSKIGGMSCIAEDFDAPTERMTSITPLLYQSGYITIKGYDETFGFYHLDIPNKEVRTGLMRSLIPYYIVEDSSLVNNLVVRMSMALTTDDMDKALGLLQEFLATVPYVNNANSEGHWQQCLYIIFSLIGYYVDAEVHTNAGRVDLVLKTNSKLYVIELKVGKSADAAMKQIDLKDYSSRFALCGLPVVNVGINFEMESHNISDWKIEDAYVIGTSN